jgi:hypothetical protein
VKSGRFWLLKLGEKVSVQGFAETLAGIIKEKGEKRKCNSYYNCFSRPEPFQPLSITLE